MCAINYAVVYDMSTIMYVWLSRYPLELHWVLSDHSIVIRNEMSLMLRAHFMSLVDQRQPFIISNRTMSNNHQQNNRIMNNTIIEFPALTSNRRS